MSRRAIHLQSPSGRSLGLLFVIAIAMIAFLCTAPVRGAGILTAKGTAEQPILIRSHHLDVTLNNGFARSEVTQVFFNPNDRDLEAVYSFPLPRSASLSEVTVWNGEQQIDGEVIEKQEAQRIYQEEKNAGNDTAIAEKNEFYTFDFGVSPVRANAEVRIRFVYYQPIEIDTGVGRFVYPLQDGGTDEAAMNFWTSNQKVEESFSARIELKSAWPVSDVRMPNAPDAQVTKQAEGHYVVELQRTSATLDRDLVFYYKLADNLPGRIELVPYRAARDQPGTFMLVVTPGVDLQPLNNGADYVFVLDVSGSMQGKIATLADGVVQALGRMQPQDRFRIITFTSNARELIGWTEATPLNVQAAAERVRSLSVHDSTNLFAGLQLALQKLDDDRATSLVLVTDGVTNTGVVDPAKFDQLMKQYDIRCFGFLMGNSANWPLMRTVCEATGGFYTGVSNDDDIVGQILLAKSKVTHEAMHDVRVSIKGVEAEDLTDRMLGKVYRGQQLVLFGRYDQAGKATFTLKARMTGEDKTYTATFELPEIDTENPEIERLWALNQVELAEDRENRGELTAEQARAAIRDLGLSYQLVTDYTSMLVLSDDAFARHGIARNNQQRVATERSAQQVRSQQPPRNRQVDQQQPAFGAPAPGVGTGGGGGGAIDPLTGVAAIGLGLFAGHVMRRRQRMA